MHGSLTPCLHLPASGQPSNLGPALPPQQPKLRRQWSAMSHSWRIRVPRGPQDSGERGPGTEWLPRPRATHAATVEEAKHMAPAEPPAQTAPSCRVAKALLTEGKARITRENMVGTALLASE